MFPVSSLTIMKKITKKIARFIINLIFIQSHRAKYIFFGEYTYNNNNGRCNKHWRVDTVNSPPQSDKAMFI